MIYLHEQTRLVVGQTERFVERFEKDYQPLMAQLGARLVALWETVPASLPWPQAIALWELDDQVHYSKLAAAQHSDARYAPQFRAWREGLGGVVSGGEGRILAPAPHGPTLADLQKEGIDASVCVHEWLTTWPDKQFDYVQQIERLWVPYARRNGRQWIGTFSTQWKNTEAISIWAFPDGFASYGEHYGPRLSRTPTELDRLELEGWMQIAIALRERYDDGLLHALRPTPLRKK
jgi:hypothetical protein